MASYTTNLNLKKPSGSENVAIGDINNNMDTIDQAVGTINSNKANKTESVISYSWLQSGATVTDILALTNGIYQNAARAASGVLPSDYGLLVVFRGADYYKTFIYFATNSMHVCTVDNNATTLTWKQISFVS